MTLPTPFPAAPTGHRILRLHEVEAKTGFKRAHLYNLMRAGRFPKALRRFAALVWRRHAHDKTPAIDFETLFHDALAGFDASPEALRIHVAQFAREIAGEARLADCISPAETDIGFVCVWPPVFPTSNLGRGVLALLCALSRDAEAGAPECLTLDGTLGPLLRGRLVPGSGDGPEDIRLGDDGFVKLFRLLRLARRLLELGAGADAGIDPGGRR
jgi:predicted DNA-binding transcriptional regulator AlpA